MAAYVRVRNRELLRTHVDATGLQNEVAARADMSPQRLSQLMTGAAPVIRARLAGRLAEVLGVPGRLLFEVDEPDLIKEYLDDRSADLVAEAIRVDAAETDDEADSDEEQPPHVSE